MNQHPAFFHLFPLCVIMARSIQCKYLQLVFCGRQMNYDGRQAISNNQILKSFLFEAQLRLLHFSNCLCRTSGLCFENCPVLRLRFFSRVFQVPIDSRPCLTTTTSVSLHIDVAEALTRTVYSNETRLSNYFSQALNLMTVTEGFGFFDLYRMTTRLLQWIKISITVSLEINRLDQLEFPSHRNPLSLQMLWRPQCLFQAAMTSKSVILGRSNKLISRRQICDFTVSDQSDYDSG